MTDVNEEANTINFAAQIRNLAVGESCSITRRYAFDNVTQESVGKIIDDIGNIAAVRRIRKQTSNEYKIECGHFITYGFGHIIFVACVTRTS